MKLTQLIVVLFVATASASLPWAFFAEVDNNYMPLSGVFLGKRFRNASMFVHEIPNALPVEFSYKFNQAYTTQKPEGQYVGFYRNELVFGPNVPSAKLILDQNWKLGSGPFYSCELLGSQARGIMRVVDVTRESSCAEVNIYLLPYDPKTRSIEFHKFSPQTSGIMPCVIEYYGENVHEVLGESLNNYNGDCEIHINGLLAYKKKP